MKKSFIVLKVFTMTSLLLQLNYQILNAQGPVKKLTEQEEAEKSNPFRSKIECATPERILNTNKLRQVLSDVVVTKENGIDIRGQVYMIGRDQIIETDKEEAVKPYRSLLVAKYIDQSKTKQIDISVLDSKGVLSLDSSKIPVPGRLITTKLCKSGDRPLILVEKVSSEKGGTRHNYDTVFKEAFKFRVEQKKNIEDNQIIITGYDFQLHRSDELQYCSVSLLGKKPHGIRAQFENGILRKNTFIKFQINPEFSETLSASVTTEGNVNLNASQVTQEIDIPECTQHSDPNKK